MEIGKADFPVREPMLVESKADDINEALMRNLGLELYGNGIIVDSEQAAKKPRIVQRFRRSSNFSVKWLMNAA